MESDLTFKELGAEIQAKQQLEGSVTLWHKRKKLTNMMAHLDEILTAGDTLVITTDRSVAVAGGGLGMGAHARAENGGLATAKGGYGAGATYEEGVLRGGRGFGGDGSGTRGGGGEGFGGTAGAGSRDKDVKAVGGRGLGGNFTIH